MNPVPKIEQAGNVRILTFAADRIRDDIETMIADDLKGRSGDLSETHVLLDFTNVEFISSLELATLINLHRRVKTAGGRLSLFNLSPSVFEVFAVTRLEQLFSICREDKPGASD